MYKTKQDEFWAGKFGDDYIDRSQDLYPIALYVYSQILGKTPGVRTILELGANIGINLEAMHALLPWVTADAVEINAKAVRALRTKPFIQDVFHGSVLDYVPTKTYDLVMTSGLMIHLAPEFLPQVYDTMVQASAKYLLVIEYYNPDPVEVPYRGHSGVLFKRDFAGELMDRHPGVELVDNGFFYRRDKNFPGGDNFWFLLKKC